MVFSMQKGASMLAHAFNLVEQWHPHRQAAMLEARPWPEDSMHATSCSGNAHSIPPAPPAVPGRRRIQPCSRHQAGSCQRPLPGRSRLTCKACVPGSEMPAASPRGSSLHLQLLGPATPSKRPHCRWTVPLRRGLLGTARHSQDMLLPF